MKIQRLRTTCLDCQFVSEQDLPVECPLTVATAAMAAMRCPNCGGKELGMGGELAPPTDDILDMSWDIERRAHWWETYGDVGLSSVAIFYYCSGRLPQRDGQDATIWRKDEVFGVPHDADDYQRCHRLLEVVPEWREQMLDIQQHSPAWKPFAEHWQELHDLYILEKPTGRASKLTARIRELEAEGNKSSKRT